MKKYLLLSILFFLIIFLLFFFVQPNFNKIIKNQLAAVIGINLNQVTKWSSQRGLNKDLTIGDSGKDVYLLQYAMNKVSPDFQSKNITGYFGQKTSKVVSDFQRKKGLKISGKLDSETRFLVNDIYFKELCPNGEENNFLDEIMIYVNKNNSLPVNYIPKDLIDISDMIKTSGIICLKQDVVPFLNKMFDDAYSQNVILAVTSGFRHPEVQSLIYKASLLIKGEKAKDRVAEPFHSEHQLGTAIDISGKSVDYISANDIFNNTVEDLWLKENAYKYGFVLSYPETKKLITGYDYEPWHYRFVGIDVAKQIFDKKISVEEYFNLD